MCLYDLEYPVSGRLYFAGEAVYTRCLGVFVAQQISKDGGAGQLLGRGNNNVHPLHTKWIISLSVSVIYVRVTTNQC